MSIPQPQTPPRTVAFTEEPCRCCTGHRPIPLECERHHVFPQKNQVELRGVVFDGRTVSLCRTAHRNTHIVLNALLRGERVPRVNAYTLAVARQGYVHIKAAFEAAGRPLPTDGGAL